MTRKVELAQHRDRDRIAAIDETSDGPRPRTRTSIGQNILENAIRRRVVTSAEEEITRAEVEAVLGNQPAVDPVAGTTDNEKLSSSVGKHLRRYFDLHGGVLPPPGLYQRILKEIELPLIEIALEATGGNQAKCADLLGINRNTLRKKITDLDIRVTRRRKLM